MVIAYLTVLSPTDRFWYEGLLKTAREMGVEIRYVRQAAPEPKALLTAWDTLQKWLNDADAFFLHDDSILHVEEYANKLYQRVKAGARLLVRLDENCLDRQNAFLAKFDLVGTRIRLRYLDSQTVIIKRTSDCFRDVRLFAGVDEVQVQQPNAIWYERDSLPILVADNRCLVIDGEKDLPADWNARDLSCFAAWQGVDQSGGILAMFGDFFSDSEVIGTRTSWSGIKENHRFAQNVIRYLIEGRPSQTPEVLCQRIEVNLTDFVFGVLKNTHSDWWIEHVPLTVRQKCAQRQEEENNRLPKEAYFDLIDLKTVMSKNWPMFEPHFRNAKREGGKEKSLAWLDKLNELRRLVGHPLKKHVAGYVFSTDEQQLLKEVDDMVKRLLESFKGPQLGAKNGD